MTTGPQATHAISDRITELWRERLREARRGYYRRWRAKETPEFRVARLARWRELYRQRKERKKEDRQP